MASSVKLREPTEEEKRKIFSAAYDGDVHTIQQLTSSGVDVTGIVDDLFNKNALHLAGQRGHNNIVTFLLSHRARINDVDDDKVTALHWAAWNGHSSIVEELVKSGANVNMKDEYNRTPLECAVSRGHIETVRYLKDITKFNDETRKKIAELLKEEENKQPGSHDLQQGNKQRRAIARFSYHPRAEDELELADGDEVLLLEVVEEGWWKGRIGQKEGIFPSNFVEEITEEAPEPLPSSSSSSDDDDKPATAPHSESVDHTPAPTFDCSTMAQYLKKNLPSLCNLSYSNMKLHLVANDVITYNEKETIDQMVGVDQMAKVLDIVQVSLKNKLATKFKGLLEAMEQSGDKLLEKTAKNLGGSKSVPDS